MKIEKRIFTVVSESKVSVDASFERLKIGERDIKDHLINRVIVFGIGVNFREVAELLINKHISNKTRLNAYLIHT